VNEADKIAGDGVGFRRVIAEVAEADGGSGKAAGIEPVESAPLGADPEGAVAVEKEGPDLIMDQGVGIMRIMHVADKTAGGGIEAADATAVGAEPEFAVTAGDDQADDVMTEGVGIGRISAVVGITAGAAVEPVEAAAMGADPEDAGGIFIERPDDRPAEPLRSVRIAGVMDERLGPGVGLADSAAVGAHPEQAGAVLKQGADLVVAQGVGIPGVVPPGGHVATARVIAIEAAIGADPDIAIPVLEEGVDIAVAERAGISGIVQEALQAGSAARLHAQAVQSVDSADPECAGAVDHEGADGVPGQAAPALSLRGEGGETGLFEQELCGREHRQPPVGPGPEGSTAVDGQGAHAVISERSRAGRIMKKAVKERGLIGIPGGLHAVEAAIASHPEPAVEVLNDGVDQIVAERGWISGGAVTDESVLLEEIAVEPAVEGARPDRAAAVLIEGGDLVIAEAVGIVGVAAQDREAIAVVEIEAVFGAEPEISPPVLNDKVDNALGQTLLDGDLFEEQLRRSGCAGGSGHEGDGAEQGAERKRKHPRQTVTIHAGLHCNCITY